jgi:hypothetical protein
MMVMRGRQWEHPMTIVRLIPMEQVQVPHCHYENLKEQETEAKQRNAIRIMRPSDRNLEYWT